MHFSLYQLGRIYSIIYVMFFHYTEYTCGIALDMWYTQNQIKYGYVHNFCVFTVAPVPIEKPVNEQGSPKIREASLLVEPAGERHSCAWRDHWGIKHLHK